MAHIYYAFFSPTKRLVHPVQLLIRLRTWGRETHVGVLREPNAFAKLLAELERCQRIPMIKIKNWEVTGHSILSAGLAMISATYPKTVIEQFTDLKYRQQVMSIYRLTCSAEQQQHILSINEQALGRRYAMWSWLRFITSPFMDMLRPGDPLPGTDWQPNQEFCSELQTNAACFVGIKMHNVYHFLAEDAIYRARVTPSFDVFFQELSSVERLSILDLYTAKINGPKNPFKWFWQEARIGKMFLYGWKISPRVMRMSPVLKLVATIKIEREGNLIYQTI